jgi:hypothetical protein
MLVSSKKSYEEKMESLTKIQKSRKNQCWASISFLLYQLQVKVYRFQKFLRKLRVICKLHKIMNSGKGKGKMMNICPVQKVREGINISPISPL